jgi:iron complex outermembrane receptor protein
MMFAALTLTAASWGGSVAEALAQADSLYVNLKDVEVTANRATGTTPVAYTNVSKAALNRQNDGRDLPYLLQSTPSLITTSDAGAGMGYTSLRIRGTEGSRINVTLNGIPINNPESHNVYWVDMPDLASSLSSIQVQRGVGTSTNGAGAFGASVNMVTDAPSEQSYGELSGAYGAYNTQRECLRVGSGLINGHWTFDAKISHQGSDGYIDRASSKLWSYLGQAAYISRKTLVRLLAFGGKEQTYMAWDYASKEEMAEYGRRYNPCGYMYTDANGKDRYYENQNDYYIQHHVQLHLAQQLSDRWNMTAALHYTRDDGYYEQYKRNRTLAEYGLSTFYTYDAEGNATKVKKSDLIRLKYNENDFGGATFSFNYHNDRLTWTTGGAANWYDGDHYGRISWVKNYLGDLDARQKYYDNTGRKTDVNIYTRADYKITDHLSGFADLQYRYIHYKINGVTDTYDYNIEGPAQIDVHRTWNFFNPKVGLNYTNGNNRLYASWSVAHREPTRDNFTDGDATHMPKAERLFDYEVGYAYNSRLFSVGVNYYFMDYKDQLVATGELSDTGNALTVNVPDSYRTGVELQGTYRPTRWFDWTLNATLSRNRIKNFVEYVYEDEWTNPITLEHGDTPIAFSPDFIGNNAFNFHARGWEASLTTQYVSKQYMNNAKSAETKLDAYCVSDLHVGYTFRHIAGIESLTLGCTVYNLFNEEYENNGYAGAGYYVDDKGEKQIYRYAGYAAQAPTHVMGTLTLKF